MSNSAQTSASSRIAALLDENSFVEVGAYIAARNTDFNMTEQETPADGVVTGYGTIGGCLVYVYSQDAAVLGGSMGEMHAKKICNIYSMAMKMGAPVIGLVDCAGPSWKILLQNCLLTPQMPWRAITRQNVILLPLNSRQRKLVWLISQVMKHLYYPRSVHWYLYCLLIMKKICLKLTAQTI